MRLSGSKSQSFYSDATVPHKKETRFYHSSDTHTLTHTHTHTITVDRLIAPPSSTQQKLHLKFILKPPARPPHHPPPLASTVCYCVTHVFLNKRTVFCLWEAKKEEDKVLQLLCYYLSVYLSVSHSSEEEKLYGKAMTSRLVVHAECFELLCKLNVFLNYGATLHKPSEPFSTSMSSFPSLPFWCNAREIFFSFFFLLFYVSWHNFDAALCPASIKEVSAGLLIWQDKVTRAGIQALCKASMRGNFLKSLAHFPVMPIKIIVQITKRIWMNPEAGQLFCARLCTSWPFRLSSANIPA